MKCLCNKDLWSGADEGYGSKYFVELSSTCTVASCCDTSILALRTELFKAGGVDAGMRSDTTWRIMTVELKSEL